MAYYASDDEAVVAVMLAATFNFGPGRSPLSRVSGYGLGSNVSNLPGVRECSSGSFLAFGASGFGRSDEGSGLAAADGRLR